MGQSKIEEIDGMIVLAFPNSSFSKYLPQKLFKLPEADIYEIWDPYFTFSYFVTRATSKSKHIMVFHDPRDQELLEVLISVDPRLKNLRRNNNMKIPYFPYYLYLRYLRPYLAAKIISKGDAYFCGAEYFIPKLKKMYNLKTEPIFMPHIAEIPDQQPIKSRQPTVCFSARWDAIKRVDRFFELVRQFPEVKFIAMGRGYDPKMDKELREIGSKIPNLEMTGLISEERKNEILEKSWILANTSIHEGLPLAFIEACSYRCALLSAVNPDDFAQNFGFHVQNDDFESGLSYLLENNRWKEKGDRGFEYVKETNDLNKVIDRRIEVYESLLGER